MSKNISWERVRHSGHYVATALVKGSDGNKFYYHMSFYDYKWSEKKTMKFIFKENLEREGLTLCKI